MPANNQKTDILALLQARQYKTAIKQSLNWLDNASKNPDALYVCGLSHLFIGQYSQSITRLEEAIQYRPDNALYTANLGIALLRSGRINNAILKLKQAIELSPEYEQAYYNLGSAYIKNKNTELAIKTFRKLNTLSSSNADYICAYADALRETGQWIQSISHYKKALNLDPEHYRSLINLAPIMMHTGQIKQAIKHCECAIKIKPDDIMPRINLGDCLLQEEQFDAAMDAYADAYDIDQNNAELCVAIGNTWLETSDIDEAFSWFNKALSIDNKNVKAKLGLINIKREQGEYEQSLNSLETLNLKHPEHIDILLMLSNAHWENNNINDALTVLSKVQSLQPDRISHHVRKGLLLTSSGDISSAIKHYQQVLKKHALCIPALNAYTLLLGNKLQTNHLDCIKSLIAEHNSEVRPLTPSALATLHNALSHYYHSSALFQKAANHMQLANNCQTQYQKSRHQQYNPASHHAHIKKLINSFSKTYFKQHCETTEENIQVVFIVAMPRSGTTLTEQMLSQHKNILTIGESNYASQSFNRYIQHESKDTQPASTYYKKTKSPSQIEINAARENYLEKLNTLREKSGKKNITTIVDKMPDNYSLIGWILTLFPNAKIIHLNREPKAIALSCWKTQFSRISWANDMNHLKHRIQQYQLIMQHWRDTIPDKFYETSYEELVKNPIAESKSLLQYLELEWDKKCLQFQQSEQLVRTASITQVRQPLYQHAVNAWQAYQDLIPGLFDDL